MHTLGIVPGPKGREAHFQDLACVLVLKGVGHLQLGESPAYHTIPYLIECRTYLYLYLISLSEFLNFGDVAKGERQNMTKCDMGERGFKCRFW